MNASIPVNVLLVDDNPANLLALEAVLKNRGYNVVLARSGQEALDEVWKSRFAVILLDVQMAEMDGFETTRRIRGMSEHPDRRDTPIIFVTAHHESQYIHTGYHAGGVDYLFKPLDPEIVRSKVAVFSDLFVKNEILVQQQRRMARLVAVQRKTTEVLAGASDVEQAIPSVLRAIGESLGWDSGSFWTVVGESEDSRLLCRSRWSASPEVAGDSSNLAEKVRVTHQAHWIQDGETSAVAFPVEVYGKFWGALEFSTSKSQPEDSDLVGLMTALGNQIGQYIAGREALHIAQDAIEARNEFLSIASHELKTPITTLKLQIEMTRRAVRPEENVAPTPQRLARTLGIAAYQIERLTGFVEHLLDVSQIHAGRLDLKFEQANLAELARDAVDRLHDQFLATSCKVELIAGEPVMIACDLFRIDQVITNLLTNAMKYGAAKPIRIRVEKDRNYARLSVEDQGIGIERDSLARIFNRFERAVSGNNFSGLGLGLYISRQIVDAHQGLIDVSSEPGMGSVFTIALPLRSPAQQAL